MKINDDELKLILKHFDEYEQEKRDALNLWILFGQSENWQPLTGMFFGWLRDWEETSANGNHLIWINRDELPKFLATVEMIRGI